MIGKKEITQFQLIFLLIHSQVGVGVVSLPFDVFMKAKGDSWISILLTGVIIQIAILLFGALMMRFPSSHLYGIAQSLFGKVIGKMIVILYSIYFIYFGSLVLEKFSYILKAWMMPLTPKWLLLVLMVVTAVYIVKGNLQLIARFFVIASVVLIGFIGFAAYALKDANLTFILPVGANGVLPVIHGINPSLYAFQGFELLLIFHPFVQSDKKGVLKAATIANIFVTLFYLFLVLTCLLFFSPEEFKLVPEPVLYLIKAFTFRIIERPDLLFTSMWIVLVATTFMSALYISSLGLSVAMNSNKIKKFVILTASICFGLAMFFHGKYEIASISRIYNNFLVFTFALGLPILFLLVSIIFNKKERGE
ncbi:spore gernimation protein [Siminovitchia terrae]|uniref:Spore gernimation protein n=1 Tax=Siminovitchia terrae TaxID=1914933 RepID=A0A429X769_SIMTE|nr:GerAB/ArcD/ProY family transporter [Siminovitchia terrae]RST59222.1 spore gernimation protein [Siminovitchia terrae]